MNFATKKNILALVCLILSLQACAQSSVCDVFKIIEQTDWKTKQITENIVLKQAQIELFDSKQSISILEIKPASSTQLAIYDAGNELDITSRLCKQADAVAGVNASYFDLENGKGSVDFVRVNGTVLHERTQRLPRSNAAMTIDKSRVQFLERDPTDAKWENKIDCDNVIVSGPLIMKNGEVANLSKDAFNEDRHPRTFIAAKADGSILLIVVDGRNVNAAGMSIYELYVLAKSLGCTDAMNFDGGGSSTMYVRGEDDNGVVNYPSDNQLFDHQGERLVGNVIYVK
jgi:exopolysaccharide biosynthesis protein